MTTLTPQNAAAVIKSYGGVQIQSLASVIVERGLAMGIYGPGGAGKTTLAATITDSPLGGPALYLNARGNPHVISSYADRIDIANITKYSQIEAIRKDLINDPERKYKSAILDTVSEMWAIDLRDLYGPNRDIEWQMHSASTADVMQLVRNWYDLTEPPYCMNVVFIFQETPEKRKLRGTEIERSEIAFNKALQWQIPTVVNWLGRLYQMEDTPPYRRMLDFRPIESMQQSKAQFDPKDALTAEMPLEVWQPSLASMVDTIRGRKPWPTEKHAKPGRAQAAAR